MSLPVAFDEADAMKHVGWLTERNGQTVTEALLDPKWTPLIHTICPLRWKGVFVSGE